MTKPSSSASFYANLTPFDDFSKVANEENYRLAPDDWFVVIADIQGSTRAIAEGSYKDVNMIGAACINAVLNICIDDAIPYVFGGDGATLLVPPHRIEACIQALSGVKQLSSKRFALALRVGVVPVAKVNQAGDCQLLVGKYRLSPVNLLATFSGGGIELAERWIKSDPQYLVEDNSDQAPDLSGLSCRWEPLASENGIILSVLVQVTEADPVKAAESYRAIIRSLGEITAKVDGGKPVCDSNLIFHWPPAGLAAEIDLTVGNRFRPLWAFRQYLYSLLQWALDRFDWKAGGYQGRQYRVELQNNTDYRRFDDTLRILLDCTSAQADEIDRMLAAHSASGRLVYGTHRADSALMTCLVFNLEKGQHIHFVDGNNGGFTSAAKVLKASLTD